MKSILENFLVILFLLTALFITPAIIIGNPEFSWLAIGICIPIIAFMFLCCLVMFLSGFATYRNARF